MILIAATLFLGLATILWKPYLSITVILLHAFVINWFALKFYPVSFSLFGSVGTVLLYFPVILLYIKGNKIIRTYSHVYILFILLFIGWLYILSLYHNVPWSDYFIYFRNNYHSFLLFPLTLYILERKGYKWVLYPILGILILQVLLFLVQMGIPSFQNYLIVEFRLTSNGWVRLVSNSLVRGNTFVGTYLRPANIGNFLAIIIPGLIILKHLKIIRIKQLYTNLFIIVLVGILMYTGIRTSFITFSIMTAGVLFFINRKIFFTFIASAIIVFILILPTIQNLSSGYDREESFENPISRISNLFEASKNETVTEETTVSRTTNMLDHYNNLLLGNSHYIQGGYYEGISSITDATLAFNLVEFGLITFLLTFILFLYPLKKLKTRPKIFSSVGLVFFIGILLQSITDQGLFTKYSSFPLFIMFALLLYTSKRTKYHE